MPGLIWKKKKIGDHYTVKNRAVKNRVTIKNIIIRYFAFAALLVLTFFFSAPPVSAETGYVSDMLLLTMRSGPGDGYSVLKTLTSNTAVEILEKGDRYLKVRCRDGDEGWVQQQYITYDLPSTMVIARMKKRIEELEAANQEFIAGRSPLIDSIETTKKDYEEKLVDLQSSLDREIKEKNRLSALLDKLKTTHEQFLNQSKDTIGLIAENKALKEENLGLSSELGEYKKTNDDLLKTSMIKWFLAGAGVLIAGWIIGRSVGASRRSSSRF